MAPSVGRTIPNPSINRPQVVSGESPLSSGGPDPSQIVSISTTQQDADVARIKMRARLLGILDTDIRPPAIFMNANRKMEGERNGRPVFIVPSPADRIDISYRMREVNSIVSLLDEARLVVVFSAGNIDLRSFVIPELRARFEKKGLTYVQTELARGSTREYKDGLAIIASTNLKGADKIKIGENGDEDDEDRDFLRELDDDPQPTAEAAYLAKPLFKRVPRDGVLIFDALDISPTARSPEAMLKSYRRTLKIVGEHFVQAKGGRAVVLINSTPLVNERRWQTFLPFVQVMGFKEDSYPALGLNPQFMSAQQAADFLGIDFQDARLLERYVPLLPFILEEFKSAMRSFHTPVGTLIAQFVRSSAGRSLVVTSHGEVNPASARDVESVTERVGSLTGFNRYKLTSDGKVIATDDTGKEPPRRRGPRIGYPNKTQKEVWSKGSRSFFDRSPILQGIPAKDYETPEKLVDKLVELRPAIILEQRKVRQVDESELEDYSLTTLVKAVAVGRGFEDEVQSYERLASARDRFERSPTLKNMDPKLLDSDTALVRFLIARRDAIAIENLHAAGKLSPDEFTFEGAQDHYALGTLIDALEAGGLIGAKRAQGLQRRVTSPLEYFIAHRDVVTADVEKAMGVRFFMPVIDRTHFMQTKNPNVPLSDYNIRKTVSWGRWFMRDPEVAVRSVYGADEIALAMSFIDGSILAPVPGNIAARIEAAGLNAVSDPAGARREAVGLLSVILAHYESIAKRGARLMKLVEEGLANIRRLYDWNRDALQTGAGARVSTVTGLADTAECSGSQEGRAPERRRRDRAVRAASRIVRSARAARISPPRIVIAPALRNIAVKTGL